MSGMEDLNYPNDGFLYYRFGTISWKKNLFDLLQEVPVFIVEKPLAGKPISIPTPTIPVVSSKSFPTGKKHSKNPISSIAIDIPEDFWKNPFDDVSERSIKDWFDNVRRRMREDEANQKLKQQTIIQQCSSTKGMTDCLGLYVRDNHPTFPSRIFVWADKIEQAGGGCTDTLLRHVILHEIGHALMDVTLYGSTPSKYFSYNDYVYKYIEEAMADAFALAMDYYWSPEYVRAFLESYVQTQTGGYREGWTIFSDHFENFNSIFSCWLSMKVIFKITINNLQYRFWNGKNWSNLSYPILIDGRYWRHHKLKCFLYYKRGSNMGTGRAKYPIHMLLDSEGSNGYVPYSDDEGKTWGVLSKTGRITVPAQFDEIEMDNNLMNNCFWAQLGNKWGVVDKKANPIIAFQYDYFWHFDTNGLCQVRKGLLYGMVNIFGNEQIPAQYDHIYNYYKGRTIAKRNGKYYIIDEQNNIIADLSLLDNWVDVREFRDPGIAKVNNSKGLWGGIDLNGNLVIPCVYKLQIGFMTF